MSFETLLTEDRTLIMGILNVTPDSFYDGGSYVSVSKAVSHAKQMVADGADILDIGGESSRPGSEPVSEDEEIKRVIPVIEALRREVDVPLSIDTYKWRVAQEAIAHGATIVNDISGGREDSMFEISAKHDVTLIVMHMQGEPKTMQENPSYDDVVFEVKKFLKQRILAARERGVKRVVVDPGIGFGKMLAHNLLILKHLDAFEELGCPILIGASRKSFIGALSDVEANERLEGTIAANVVSVMKGARIVLSLIHI